MSTGSDAQPLDSAEALQGWIRTDAECKSSSLHDFFHGAWDVLEAGTELSDSLALQAICDHLQAVTEGEIQDLIITVPPRFTKSTTVSVIWPAWEWTRAPSTQWLFATYVQSLTLRDSVRCRDLICSKWYQRRWGAKFQLSAGQREKSRFTNDAGGHRVSICIGGMGTGEGGDRIVVDDPHNMQEIKSDLRREDVIAWWRRVILSRRNNPKTSARVVIGQRGHSRDLIGWLLSQGEWVHLNLPMLFEKDNRCVTYYQRGPRAGEELFRDPRTKEGELLDPVRMGPAEVSEFDTLMSVDEFDAQLQQNPVRRGGNILKAEQWREWPKGKPLPIFSEILQVYDTAYEQEEENDPSARTTWGIFEYEDAGAPKNIVATKGGAIRRVPVPRDNCMLLERMNQRLEYPDLRAMALDSAEFWKPDKILIEKKSSGHALAQEMRRAPLRGMPGLPIKRIRVRDSKHVRAHLASLVLEQGAVWYVRRNWAMEVIEQCAQFPRGDHDDMCDTVVLALLYMRRRWLLDLEDEEQDEDDMDLARNVMRLQAKRLYGGGTLRR